jgi:hypothetical protein
VGFLEKCHDQARSGIHFSGNAVFRSQQPLSCNFGQNGGCGDTMLLYRRTMKNNQAPYHELILLPPILLILARQALAGQPVFRSEFAIEDFILLLTLACFFAPSRFKRFVGLVINCSMSTTMTLIVWTTGAHRFPLVLFAMVAIYSAVLALIELSKLRKHGLNGIPPQ